MKRETSAVFVIFFTTVWKTLRLFFSFSYFLYYFEEIIFEGAWHIRLEEALENGRATVSLQRQGLANKPRQGIKWPKQKEVWGFCLQKVLHFI